MLMQPLKHSQRQPPFGAVFEEIWVVVYRGTELSAASVPATAASATTVTITTAAAATTTATNM